MVISSRMEPRPRFEDLPRRGGDPPYSCWGLYGGDDQLGTLNLLTAGNTLAAAKDEIQTGVRVALDPPLDALRHPAFGRKPTKHEIMAYTYAGRLGHDDTLEFNTQIGAQWDGFRHVAYRGCGKFYNDTSVEGISGSSASPDVLGTQSWVQNGSIAGRGVLLDFYAYSQAVQKHYDLINSDYAITYEDLQDCARHQGTEIRQGDLLFLRSGFWVGYHGLTNEEKEAWSQVESAQCQMVGVEASRQMAQWLWDSGIAACAGDAPAWENVSPGSSSTGLDDLTLHEIMLSGWGMPIGEMFDLEKLGEECKRHGRWTFFVTSAPLHVRGGVASPPNCMAIF